MIHVKLNRVFVFLSFFMMVISCQKESAEPNNTSTGTTAARVFPKNECRLTLLAGAGVEYRYRYNSAGLNSEMEFLDYGTFRQEYDASGKLIKSRWFIGEDLIVTIHFFYDARGKANHEIWYLGDTDEIYDEVFYTRNNQGLITRMESFLGDYFTTASFTPDGNTKEWHFHMGGARAISGYLSYKQPYRNPYLAVPGIEYSFPFANPFYYQHRNLPVSEKVVVYDENGTPMTLFDYDPAKTIVQEGHRNYPLHSELYDRENEIWDQFVFEYENCGPGSTNNLTGTSQSITGGSETARSLNQLFKRMPGSPLKIRLQQQRDALIRQVKRN